MNSSFKKLYVIDLGLTKFKDTWDLQKKLANLRFQSKIPDCLIITEHEPVITIGQGGKKDSLPVSSKYLHEHKIDVLKIEYDKDINFYGPGQVVAYPIIDLTARGKDLRRYLRELESVEISLLEEVGLKASARKGLSGVWVNNCRLGSISLAVSRWVSFHALALNVNIDLEYFKLIDLYGTSMFQVGSISSMLGNNIGTDDVRRMLIDNFARLFGYQIENVKDIKSLLEKSAVA